MTTIVKKSELDQTSIWLLNSLQISPSDQVLIKSGVNPETDMIDLKLTINGIEKLASICFETQKDFEESLPSIQRYVDEKVTQAKPSMKM